MPIAFLSYSHADEGLRDQLEKHLSGLKRQGAISSWHDRRIMAGENVDDTIDSHLDAADIVLLLISPDFIASNYCYEREMKRALERHAKGEARVIPVILRPCLWHDLPFGKLLATPKDGKAITTWTNIDSAFVDVVTSIKNALEEVGPSEKPVQRKRTETATQEPRNSIQAPARSSNLRITKKFTDLDRDRFRHDGFEFIAKFFENSLKELVARNAGVEQTFAALTRTVSARRRTGTGTRFARARRRWPAA